MPDVSIAISAKDNYSGILQKIRQNQTAFRKDAVALQKELDKFNNTKVNLKVDFEKAKRELQAAQKEFKKTGEAAELENLKKAQANYDNISGSLRAVSNAAKNTQKDLDNIAKTQSRNDSRTSGRAMSSMMMQMGKAGLYQEIGNVASEAATTFISSAYGSRAGNYASGIISGAASGAAIGSMIAPGIGTAIGAGVGAVTGLASAATQDYKERDEAFKDVVRTQYQNVSEKYTDMLTGGIGIASGRETNRLKFNQLIGVDKTNEVLPQLQAFAEKTPFAYDTIMESATKLLTYNVGADELMSIVKRMGDLSGGDNEKLSTIIRSYGKMVSSRRVSREFLDPMSEAGVPIINELAKGKYGNDSAKSIAKIYDDISDRDVTFEQLEAAIKRMTDEGGKFYGMMDSMSQTYTGLASTAEEMDDNLRNAMGEGYNEKRKEGFQKSIEFSGTETYDKLKEGYAMIGEFQADLENTHEQELREAFEKTMESQAYQDALMQGNRAEAGRLLKQAEVDAQIAYINSDGYQLMLSSEKSLVSSMRNSLAGSWENFGYQMGLEFNKGLAATSAGRQNALTPKRTVGDKYVNTNVEAQFLPGNAWGLSYVPYDGYATVLHQGERVMTASENREYSSGRSGRGDVIITGNNFNVRSEADIDAIAYALASKLEEAKEGYVT